MLEERTSLIPLPGIRRYQEVIHHSFSKTTKQNRKCLFSRQLLWHQEVWDALDMQEVERPLGIEVTKDVENGDEGKA